MGKTVIVTGGCGYIGSHILRAFKYADHTNKVYSIDWVKREHTLKNVDGYLINDFDSIEATQYIKNINPDVIVHCAGTSLVGPSITNPALYYHNNVTKTISLMNVIKDMPKKPSIIFSSSAAVYGQPNVLPVPEDHAVNPISPYGTSKLIIEMVLKDYGNAYGINSTCFRYFNAAGAWPVDADLGQEPGATHIIGAALEASLAGSDFLLNGTDFPTHDGTCIRDYIHVMDLATAHIKASEYMDKNPGSYIFNLGTNTGTSNKEIIDYINLNYGLKNVINGPRRVGDPAELVADACRAKEMLTWQPINSTINSIIDDAYKWYAQK
jgi:UDP-glucose-4-epimerase GalE